MHLGIIPDGHRRYANENSITKQRSYLTSQHRLNDIIDQTKSEQSSPVLERIEEISIYAMSEDNLKRDNEELEIFYDALREYFLQMIHIGTDNSNKFLTKYEDYETIMDTNFVQCSVEKLLNGRSTVLGDSITSLDPKDIDIEFISTRMDAAPSDIQEMASDLEEIYCGDQLKLNILFMYSGRNEITQAAKLLSLNGEDYIENVTVSDLSEYLELKDPIDLVIRTGDNVTRECLSDFCIFQSAYSEYVHIQKNFPAVEMDDIINAVNHFSNLRRKKGK